MDSLHAATRNAAAASPARLCILERSDVEGSTLRAEHVRGADHQCVAVPQLVDAQIRERRPPLTAVTVFVPDSVPGRTVPPLWPMAIVTDPLKLVTRLPPASSAVTCTAG